MNTFNLPDLGEGLPDAEIKQWYVKEGDQVKTDQPLVAMETAKAVVDVPAPQDGTIVKLFGQEGDIIKTNEPLIEFDGKQTEQSTPKKSSDKATVVGDLASSDQTLEEDFIIGSGVQKNKQQTIQATPAVRALAKKLDVDLNQVKGSGKNNQITASDVENCAKISDVSSGTTVPVRGARRAMAMSMSESHAQVVPVTLYDDADIEHWGDDADITVRLIQALVAGCKQEPTLNTWYDSKAQTCQQHQAVHLGLAVDTEDGLFVPVIKDAEAKSDQELRVAVDQLKQHVQQRSLTPEALQGATITLSNFGKFAGRYATPIIVPPCVAILAVGKVRSQAVADKQKVAVHRIVPLSLTFDHRAVTGGEASRFLGAVIASLES